MKKITFLYILLGLIGIAMQSCKSTASVSNQGVTRSIKITSKTKNITLNGKKIRVAWLSPITSNEIKLNQNKLHISLQAFSSIALDDSHFTVFLNDRKLGAKANETSLFGSKNQFTFKSIVALQEGSNKIEVQVAVAGGRSISKPLWIKYNNGFASIDNGLSSATKAPSLLISWIDPDPILLGEKMLVHKNLELKINLKINSNRNLSKKHITVFHNNLPLIPSHRSKLIGAKGSYRFNEIIQLDDRKDVNKIYIVVTNEAGKKQSETLNVNFSPHRPNLFILSIGPKTNLKFTDKDALDFAKLYSTQGGRSGNQIFNSVETETLTGTKAKAGEIEVYLERLISKVASGVIGKDDVVMLFISSHGFLYNNDFRIQGDNYSIGSPKSTSISYQYDIMTVLDQLPCKKIVFIDACHGGAAGGGRDTESKAASAEAINIAIKQLNQSKGLLTIASSRANEYSYEDEVWKNGAFTKSIILGLGEGQADEDKNNIITVIELFDFLKKKVPQLVQLRKNKPQHPTIVKNDLGNVAIFVTQ